MEAPRPSSRGCFCLSKARAGEQAANAQAAESDALRSELQAMKLRALKLRATEAGVDAEAIAEADDAEDIKGAVIRLILAEQARGTLRSLVDPLVRALQQHHRHSG